MKERLKRIFCALALILAFLFAVAAIMWFRGQSLAECTYSVPCRAGEKIRIVALADLHGKLPEEKQEAFVQRIESADPDLIVYLGDMVDSSTPEQSAAVLKRLTERLIEIAPICYVDGNHEQYIRSNYPELYADLNDSLTKAGAVQLENEIVQLRIAKDHESSAEWILGDTPYSENFNDYNGTFVNLCGITTHYYWGVEEAALADKLRSMNGINVMLCHYPESVIWYDAFDPGGLDLAVCGHTHGGLIRLPIVGGMKAPEQEWWPKYDRGQFPIYTDTTWYQYGGADDSQFLGTMIISGGLAGEHGVPRINNPKEISILEVGNKDWPGGGN